MRKTLVISGVLAFVIGAAVPASAQAASASRIHWGPVTSSAGHSGQARADVWITDFSAETFAVYGKLYDRDAHRGHCAYLRARFHYVGGGTGWSRPRTTCSAKSPFRLTSDGQIRRVDVKVCLYDSHRRKTVWCHADAIKPEIIANWPQ
ncbi:hypothetical protein [Nonomuraea cavernae]|uniref:Secreted protein n=1 Tax=Nonomuraea cavernae TaxID=2045107 RepID=A0A918DQY6_9ACTN|nr:hypothetical protein [Nonomuraea cavernae]MCA2186373.1 hypothetical protein [Nonomuraea cavernae]GGO79325.1 hypothetical protein GCM10012289_63360 [Nonomuraea cavernae]